MLGYDVVEAIISVCEIVERVLCGTGKLIELVFSVLDEGVDASGGRLEAVVEIDTLDPATEMLV